MDYNFRHDLFCLPTPMALASGGEFDIPTCGTLASSTVTPAVSVHKSRGDNVGAVGEMMCVWMLQRGHSGDGCVLARLCVNMT